MKTRRPKSHIQVENEVFHDGDELGAIFNPDFVEKRKTVILPDFNFPKNFFQKHMERLQIFPKVGDEPKFRLENRVHLPEDIKNEVSKLEVGIREGNFERSEQVLDLSKGVFGRCNVPSPFVTVLTNVQKSVDGFSLFEKSREGVRVEQPSRWAGGGIFFFLGVSGFIPTKAV